jgi:hypothetical protein
MHGEIEQICSIQQQQQQQQSKTMTRIALYVHTNVGKSLDSGTGNRTRACWVRASYPNP